jgi:hypothetical protein
VPTAATSTTPTEASPSASPEQRQLAPGDTTCAESVRYGINGAGEYRLTGPCAAVSIGTDDAEITVSGAVAALNVNGQHNEVDAGDITAITIAGDDNDVEGGAVTSVQVQGQSNEVTATGIETINVAGDRNEIKGGSRIGVVTVNGNDNEFEAKTIDTRNDNGSRNRFTVG